VRQGPGQDAALARIFEHDRPLGVNDKPGTLAEAMAALEKGLAAYFEREGIEVE